jgi:hypothetical protein
LGAAPPAPAHRRSTPSTGALACLHVWRSGEGAQPGGRRRIDRL